MACWRVQPGRPPHLEQTTPSSAVQQASPGPAAASTPQGRHRRLTWNPSARTKPARSQAPVRARTSATCACAALRPVGVPHSERGLVQGLQLLAPQPDPRERWEGGEGEASCCTLAWCRLLAPSTAGSSASSSACRASEAAAGEPNAPPSACCSAAPCWQPAIICSHTPWLCCRRSASWARVARISSRHDCTSALRSAGVPGTVEAAEACSAWRRGTGAAGGQMESHRSKCPCVAHPCKPSAISPCPAD